MYNDLIKLFLAGGVGKEIIDSLPIAIYATDKEGRLTYFNSTAAKLSGREPEPGTDEWWMSWKLYYPDGTPMPYKECPMAVTLKEGHSTAGAEVITERPDGARVWFRAYSTPLPGKEGETIGAINLLVDITDQKKAENERRQYRQELVDFFENAAVGLHWVNADGTVKRVNQAELDMLGYSREEFVGRHISEFHADQEVVENIMKKLSAGEELHDYEVRLRCKDGSIKHVLMSSNVYRKNGKFIHTRCITRDITQRKKAQAELMDMTAKSEQQKRLYEAIISSTPDLVYVFDLNYRFTFTNDALLEMWGLTREESMGKTLLEVGYEPWHAEMHEREIDQVIATKQPVQGEVSFPHAKFGKRIYDYIFVPVLDEKGKVEAVAGTTRDVTKRKKVEEELKAMNETLEARVEERTQALLSYQDQLRSLATQLNKSEEKQREQLASELHDNLGQLLAVGKLKIDQLRVDQLTDQESKSFKELEGIIDDALMYTRELMSDLKPPPSIEGDLKASLGWVADKVEKHGLTVTIDDDKLPKPLSEEVRGTVIQSVRELLFNVLKHTSEKEAVVVLRSKKDQLHITVKDDGDGFGEKNMELTPNKDGKFGLFNIQERIDLLGGDIDIEAKTGEGTKVTLYVPLAEENKVVGTLGQGGDIAQVNASRDEERIKVLLVDDHQMFREGIRKIIEEEEDILIVGEASDGEEAIHLTRKTVPDIILMDINMPVMDGIEATRKITSEMPGTRIIGLSLYDGGGVVDDMRNAGASAYLTKTEAFESLILTIRAEASSSTG